MMLDPLRGNTSSKSMVIDLLMNHLLTHKCTFNELFYVTITFDPSTVPPDFHDSETPSNVSVVLSKPISLVCDVTGSPTPVITWYKDGAPVGETLLTHSTDC